MADPYNALYPQAPMNNALYYDDTQGMPRQRPADPLRWLADYIGQNKDLPAPQFFMDPRALSARNMLHSALNTSANWLDGTQDPSLIGPAEVVSPLGLAGMGTGLANAMTRPAARHVTGGDMHRGMIAGHPRIWVDGVDGATPASVGRLQRAGDVGGAMPSRERVGFAQNDVMAENARSSAPGTVINSLDMSEAARMARAKEQGFDEATYYKGHYPYSSGGPITDVYGRVKSTSPYVLKDELSGFFSANPEVANKFTGLGGWFDNGAVAPVRLRYSNPLEIDAQGKHAAAVQFDQVAKRDGMMDELDRFRTAFDKGHDAVIIRNTKDEGDIIRIKDPQQVRSTQAAFDPAKRDSANLLAASPTASAPGLAANSTQQDGSGIGDFLHRNFVDATVPLSSDENEWAQEMMGQRELRLNDARYRGKVITKTITDGLDAVGQIIKDAPAYTPLSLIDTALKRYGTGGPIEPVNSPENSTQPPVRPVQQDDQGVMSILKRYGLAD